MSKLMKAQGFKLSILCSAVSLLLSSNLAFAQQRSRMGTKDGGGGGAYVCRDGGRIIQVRLVDLWESEHDEFEWANGKVETLKFEYTDVDSETQFENAMQRLALVNSELANQVRIEKEEIFKNIVDPGPKVGLPKPSDLETQVYPILVLNDSDNGTRLECKPEGMMFYQNGKLKVKKELMDKLSKTDLAAAWVHEAIYKVFRDRESVVEGAGSAKVRRLVGCLFSGKHDKNNLPDIYDDSCLRKSAEAPIDRLVLSCSDSKNEVTVFPTDKNIKTLADVVANSDHAVKSSGDIATLTRLRIVVHKFNGIQMRMAHMSDIKYWTPRGLQSIDPTMKLDHVGQGLVSGYNQSELSTFDYRDFDILLQLDHSRGYTFLDIENNKSAKLNLAGIYYNKIPSDSKSPFYKIKRRDDFFPDGFGEKLSCEIIN